MQHYRRAGIVTAFVVSAGIAMGAVNLSGTSYVQEFDGMGGGLPTGWNVYTSASTDSLGTLETFNTATTSWGDTAGRFKNFASAEGQGSGWSPANQSSSTNRALGIRQSGTDGDPGAAFVVVLEDTLGLQNLNLSFQAQLLSVQGRSTDWVVDYRVGPSGHFTPLGVYADPNVFSAATMATGFNLAAFGGDIDNQAENVYIRIWAKEESSGSGSRDSFGLSHFVLTYNELTGPVRTVRPTGSATLSYAMNDNTTRPAYSGEAADSVRGSFVVAANGSVSYFGGTTDNALVATGWTESGSIDLDADQRYAFDLRLADGVEGTVDEISFTAQRSSTGPSTLYVYSSQNPDSGFTLLGQTPVSVSESFAQFTFSNLALDFEDVCFFRVYGDGATASAGNLRFDDLSINLTVIPEPSTVLAMALGFGLLANELRRRRHSA